MDKLKKFLQKLTSKELAIVLDLLQKIKKGNFIGLSVKKLKGYTSAFRVRAGDIRVIYRVDDKGRYHIVDVGRRSEKTYRNL